MEKERHIEGMPTFSPDVVDINPVTLSKLTQADRLMHDAFMEVRREISVLRQENRWLAKYVIASYNRGLQHDNMIESTRRTFMGIPTRIIVWLATGAGGAALAVAVENWINTKK